MIACATNITSTLAFGGRAWPISADDMNLGIISGADGLCVGALFDIDKALAYVSSYVHVRKTLILVNYKEPAAVPGLACGRHVCTSRPSS